MAHHDLDWIAINGARANNLRNVDIRIPHGKITVFTGVSGSGKSSLVFDTIAAESQRQLNDTFPAFVRHRLPHLGKPQVDSIEHLTTSVVIDQRPFSGNARSTVATATDLAPLLRLLYSRLGTPFVGYSDVFSFNQPAGMCPACQGLGTIDDVDADALIDPNRSLNDGALVFPTFTDGTAYWKRYVHSGLFDNDRPLRRWSTTQLEDLLYAQPRTLQDPPAQWYRSAKYEGLVPRFRRLYLQGGTSGAGKVRRRYAEDFERVVTTRSCPQCHGARLRQEVLACRIQGRNIAEASQMPVQELSDFLAGLQAPALEPVLQGLAAGLSHLQRVGLGYLALDRVSSTLSGGEAQRVKMVRSLGSSLTRMTYILDEPSVGLHPSDVHRLNDLLLALRDTGNTVLVVEHDPDVIVTADHVVDLGPGAGAAGGAVVFAGSVAGLRRAKTPTGKYLRRRAHLAAHPRRAQAQLARVRGAERNNLRGIDVDIPAGVLCVLTGVAGSGKTSVLSHVLAEASDLRLIDQRGVRGGKRSMPVTYLGALDDLRGAFAVANAVGVQWFSPSSAGACPVCRGTGLITTDLAFLDDTEVVCDACAGSRFNDKALSYTLDGLTIAEAFDVRATDAAHRFTALAPAVAAAGARMSRAGVGYLTLGQALNTLSGGERQRLKLARELGSAGRAYAFDEPTTGLHGRDVSDLLRLFDDLIEDGSSLVVVEHDLDVMAHADWIIDIGPGAGQEGGRVIFEGTPQELVASGGTATAEHLSRWVAG